MRRHTFHRSLVLAEGESADAWREVTPAQKAQIEAEDEARPATDWAFVEEWRRWGTVQEWAGDRHYSDYDEARDCFSLNGITDIDWPEARAIMAYAHYTRFITRNTNSQDETQWAFAGHWFCTIRTVFPLDFKGGGYTGLGGGLFAGWTGLEVIEVANCNFRSRYSMFKNCTKLRRVNGLRLASNYADWNNNMFDGCPALVEVYCKHLNTDLSLKDSPLLSMESVKYLISQRWGTNSITLTLHPSAYARVTDEIFEAAALKNITIASA